MQGISTVVVIIIILMITVALSALSYMFFSGIFTTAAETAGNLTETTTAGMTAQMKIESVSGKDIYIRNVGLAELSGFNVYVNDVSVSYTIDKSPLKTGEVAKINLTNAPSGTIRISATPIAIATYIAPVSPTCPDGTCAAGENCPADASACSEPAVCRYRTCANGCNNPAGYIASASQDTEGSNLCNNAIGCASPPCVCDGSGNCISSGDTTKPTWSTPEYFAPSTYSSTKSEFNITWTDNVGVSKVLIEMNYSGTNNYSMTNSYGGNKYNYSIILPAGIFYWKSYANDTSNNQNSSTKSEFTISKATLGGSVTANDVTYPTSVSASSSESNNGDSDVVYQLFCGNTLFGSQTGSAPCTGGCSKQLGAGSYTCKLNTTGATFANYSSSASIATDPVTVNKGIPTGSLTCSGAGCWNSVVSGTQVTIGYTESNSGDGDCSYVVWRDGVNKGSGETWTPPVGSYNYKLNTSGCTNYSAVASMNTNTLTVTAVADTTKPTWSNLGVNNSNPAEGNGVLMYSQWNDNVQLDKYIFSWNATGTDCGATSGWQNESWASFTNNWTNTSKTIPTGCVGKTIGFRFYGRDTSLNENVTNIATINVQSAGGEVVNMVELLTDKISSSWGTGSSNPDDPYSTWYHDNRAQAVYLASELQAAGIPTGAKIIGISLNVYEQPGRDLANSRVRLQHTASTISTSWVTSGWTLTYGPTNIPKANLIAGNWYNHTFHTNFTWDGTSNLLIDLSRDDTAYTQGGGMYKRADGITNRMCTCYHDSSYTWPFDGCTAAVKSFVPAIKIIYVTST